MRRKWNDARPPVLAPAALLVEPPRPCVLLHHPEPTRAEFDRAVVQLDGDARPPGRGPYEQLVQPVVLDEGVAALLRIEHDVGAACDECLELCTDLCVGVRIKLRGIEDVREA